MPSYQLLVKTEGSKHSEDILRYVDKIILNLNKFDIYILPIGFKNKDLNQNVIEELKQKGIETLPSLITESGNHTGFHAIMKILQAAQQQSKKPPKEEGDMVSEFYKKQMDVKDQESEDGGLDVDLKKMQLRKPMDPLTDQAYGEKPNDFNISQPQAPNPGENNQNSTIGIPKDMSKMSQSLEAKTDAELMSSYLINNVISSY